MTWIAVGACLYLGLRAVEWGVNARLHYWQRRLQAAQAEAADIAGHAAMLDAARAVLDDPEVPTPDKRRLAEMLNPKSTRK